jgi:hypothetical protein
MITEINPSTQKIETGFIELVWIFSHVGILYSYCKLDKL